MSDDDPLKPKTFNQQLLAGGRAHPVIGWVVLGLGIGGAVGASNDAMGESMGIGAALGFAAGIFITRGFSRRRKRRDEP